MQTYQTCINKFYGKVNVFNLLKSFKLQCRCDYLNSSKRELGKLKHFQVKCCKIIFSVMIGLYCQLVIFCVHQSSNKPCTNSSILLFVSKPPTYIASDIAEMINDSMTKGFFPDSLKFAEMSSLFKKKDTLNKVNYRPVSILVAL